ncbi:MAG: 6-carboxytetrahydropterin synthase, partial [Bdellovibrionales bacterium]|nr:6-carboxytetrahydropterin synthase [Bdellovibrionales bacterium]
PWDHAFIAYEKDHAVIEFLNSLKDHKTVLTPLPPTAEHLADLAFDKLNEAIQKKYGQTLQLKRLRLYETPTSWAEVQA